MVCDLLLNKLLLVLPRRLWIFKLGSVFHFLTPFCQAVKNKNSMLFDIQFFRILDLYVFYVPWQFPVATCVVSKVAEFSSKIHLQAIAHVWPQFCQFYINLLCDFHAFKPTLECRKMHYCVSNHNLIRLKLNAFFMGKSEWPHWLTSSETNISALGLCSLRGVSQASWTVKENFRFSMNLRKSVRNSYIYSFLKTEAFASKKTCRHKTFPFNKKNLSGRE